MKIKMILVLLFLLPPSLWANYHIYPQVSAQILEIGAAGQSFKKGAVLVKLDDRLAQAELIEQLVILNIKQQLLDDAKLTHHQTQQLFDNLVRSNRELELAQIEHKQAQYELEVQQAKVKQYQLKLDYYQIKAPFDLVIEQVLNPRNTTNHYQPQPLLLVK